MNENKRRFQALMEQMECKRYGYRAFMVYTIQRGICNGCSVLEEAEEIGDR